VTAGSESLNEVLVTFMISSAGSEKQPTKNIMKAINKALVFIPAMIDG
jgi:hypothetical protein